MQISQAAWSNYVARLSALNQKAGQAMAGYIKTHGTGDTEALTRYAWALVTKYGEGSAELACQMYEAIAEAEGVRIPAAQPAETAEYGEVARMVQGTKDSPPEMQSGVSRMVKRTGADTVLKNAIRDGAEFAWVPHGDSCAFCITLASRGWQRASKKALKNGHAEHIHAHCDCEYAVRFGRESSVKGYDPDEYWQRYQAAGGDINAMRRESYAANREKINAQKRAAWAEQHRRRIGSQGQQIIDKPTYNKITRDFLKHDGIIIRGDEAEQHLKQQGAYASYMAGGNFAFIRDDATVSDVLEEMYHAWQDRTDMFTAEYESDEIILRREIDAQNYLLSVIDKYKIPVEESSVTKRNLEMYENLLEELIEKKGGGTK